MGNESSQLLKYGEKLENDLHVKWNREAATSYISSRDGHVAAVIPSGNIFIFGGVTHAGTDSCTELNDIIMLDKEFQGLNSVACKGDIPAARSCATMEAVKNKLYLFGGLSKNLGWFNDMYCFDTETNTWHKIKTKSNGPTGRDKQCSTVVGNYIYYFGGFGPKAKNDDDASDEEDVDGAEFGWFNELYIFDTESYVWSQPVQVNVLSPSPRAAAGMAAVGTKIVIFGGRDQVGRQNDLHVFDTVSCKWDSQISSLISGCQPQPRSFHTVTSVGNRIVVLGGRGLNNQHFDDFHVFDIDAKQWLQPCIKGDFLACGCHTAIISGEKLVVYGGSSNFDQDSMQCQTFHGEIYTTHIDGIVNGRATKHVDPQTSTTKINEHSSDVKLTSVKDVVVSDSGFEQVSS